MKKSARISRFLDSLMGNRLATEISMSFWKGPRNTLRPTLPMSFPPSGPGLSGLEHLASPGWAPRREERMQKDWRNSLLGHCWLPFGGKPRAPTSDVRQPVHKGRPPPGRRAWGVSDITPSFPWLFDGVIEALIEINEGVSWPDLFLQSFFADDFAGVF